MVLDIIQTYHVLFYSYALKPYHRIKLSSTSSTSRSKLIFLLGIKYIIVRYCQLWMRKLQQHEKRTDNRVKGGLAKLKSINCLCPIPGPIRDT